MKIIDLLNKIANGEEVPKKFIYDNQLFILDEEDNVYRSHLGNRFGAMYQLDIKLNDEIEILEGTLEEEKKIPEKIPLNYTDDRSIDEVCEYLRCEFNQLIDYLKSKGDE